MKITHSLQRKSYINAYGGMMSEKEFLRICFFYFSTISHVLYIKILRNYGHDDPLKMSSGSWVLDFSFLPPFLPSLYLSIPLFLPLPTTSLPIFVFFFFSFHYRLKLWSFLSSTATYHQMQQAWKRCSSHSPNLLNETN